MTYEQIVFANDLIRKFENQKKETSFEKMNALIDRSVNYFVGMFDHLRFKTYRSENGTNLHQDDYREDCNKMIFTIQGELDKDPNKNLAISLSKDISAYKNTYKQKNFEKGVKELYYKYNKLVDFGKIIEKAIIESNSDTLNLFNHFDRYMLQGMVAQLEQYINDLCSGKIKPKQTKPNNSTKINIINNNKATASSDQSTSINIKNEINNAIEQTKELCLPDLQEKEVLEKLEELNNIVSTKGTSAKKWLKLKGLFKWVAEQGIQVASIIVPLIAKGL